MTLQMFGAIKNLYVRKGTALYQLHLHYKNEITISLICVMPTQSHAACSDTINSVSVITGDHISMGIRSRVDPLQLEISHLQ